MPTQVEPNMSCFTMQQTARQHVELVRAVHNAVYVDHAPGGHSFRTDDPFNVAAVLLDYDEDVAVAARALIEQQQAQNDREVMLVVAGCVIACRARLVMLGR